MNSPRKDLHAAWRAIAAMLLLVVAAVWLGDRARLATGAEPGTSTSQPAWLHDIESGADHIDARELAAELMAGHADVVLVDVRPAAEYAAYHLPSAINLSVPELCGDAGSALFARQPRLVVLYSNGPAHPGQAWVELRRRGHSNVRVLDGGLEAFYGEILTPPSLRPLATATTATAAAGRFALQRAFFARSAPPAPTSDWATDPPQLTEPTMVSTSWLAQRLDRVTVVDVRRDAAAYAALHVPGAVHLDPAELRDRHGDREWWLHEPARLATLFGARGIGVDTPVVLCSDDSLPDAALTALALWRCGHHAVAILDGGLRRWAAERRPLVATTTPVTPTTYQLRPPADDCAIPIDELAARVAQQTVNVVDVRPAPFFRGEMSTEARPGHIPGAKNRPLQSDVMVTDTGVWLRPRKAVQQAWQDLGAASDRPVVVSCRTGHTASAAWFVLRHLLGHRQTRWFNGSWTEWAQRTDLPAATGDR